MVMVLSESLSTRGADSIACGTFSPELHTPKKMSQGPTLFSCGIMENDRWRDLDRKCPLQIDQPSTSIWECLPEKDNSLWHREAVTACAVTSLIKDLSISDHSRSQPCVLNDKKVGVKRRRPEEVQEQRPSLDLAKMAQNCQTFSSLSCLSAGTEDCGPQSPFARHVSNTRAWTALLSASGPGGRTPAGTPVPEPLPSSFDDHLACQEDLSCEESDGCALDEDCGRRAEPAAAWRDRGATGNSLCSLDGELDIEQIEKN